MNYRLAIVFGLALLAPALWGQAAKPAEPAAVPAWPKLDGQVVESARARFTLAPAGLPEQLELKPTRDELPLEKQDGKTPPSVEELAGIGRGPQLRAPLRLEATIAGAAVPVTVATPATPALADGTVRAQSQLTAGALKLRLDLRYARDGALLVTLGVAGDNTAVESLALVLDLAGAVDLVIPGAPLAAKPQAYPEAPYHLSAREGVRWGNAKAESGALPPLPGVPSHVFLGSGDRGFTWLCDDPAGFAVTPDAPMMTLSADAAGALTWRIRLINTPTKIGKERTLSFALLTHPAMERPANSWPLGWLLWPKATPPVAAPALTLKARQPLKEPGLVRGDAATVHEAFAAGVLLAGPSGGDGLSPKQDLADTFPMPLWRYLAGTHTGLAAFVRSNAAALTTAGAARGPDRAVLGRALLNGIGADAATLAHRMDALRVVTALERFGFFALGQPREFLPWWRSSDVVRYGEVFAADDAFKENDVNPTARAYVAAFRRPVPGKKGSQALIVVVNESDQPLREQLYVLKPDRLFGGGNALREGTVVGQLDFGRVPGDSDWNQGKLVSNAASVRANPREDPVVLQDAEDGGFVQRPAAKDGVEVYGPLFVPPHDFRLLLGSGAP